MRPEAVDEHARDHLPETGDDVEHRQNEPELREAHAEVLPQERKQGRERQLQHVARKMGDAHGADGPDVATGPCARPSRAQARQVHAVP